MFFSKANEKHNNATTYDEDVILIH